MLDRIVIDNFATIEHVSFDLGEGLNIITGETGAGKSVLVEAISTVLGARADISMVRTGTKRSVIQILGTYHGEEMIISREITANGKSVCKLNGELISLAALRAYCSGLVDIHGQYDNQQILDPENHIRITDSFRNDLIATDLEILSSLYSDYRDKRSAYERLLARESETLRQQEFYRFEYDNISSLSLRSGEEDELRSEFEMMRNSERIYSAVNGTYELLHESESAVIPSLNTCAEALSSIASYSDDLRNVSEDLNDIYYRLEDISAELRSMRDRFSFSEQDMDDVSSRLSLIEEAKRKYRRSVDEIIEYHAELEEKLSVIDNYDDAKASARSEMDSAYAKLSAQADKVSKIRHDNADVLAAAIRQELADLEFSNTGFEVSITRSDEIGPSGYDVVEFLISTNPGEPLKPLTKVASGGEISRVMLAFKRIIGDGDKLDTMIFDEIDTGISGKTALVVGRKLLEIASHHQVVCITHLPQIAAYGQDNYLISKAVIDGKSNTSVDHLDLDGKIRTIANLISGDPDNESSLKAARELIDKVTK